MRFTTVCNAVYGGKAGPQFELHKAECLDVPTAKYKSGEAQIVEAREIADALKILIDADLVEMGYSVSDVKIFNCCRGGKEIMKIKDETKQNLKPANKLSHAEREKQIAEHVAKKKADVEAKKKSGEGIDKALNDEMVKPTKAKPEKPPVDPNLLSVSDIARELEIEPKAARAKLRRVKGKASEGRWPKVKRDSKEYKEIVEILSAEPEVEEEESDEAE